MSGRFEGRVAVLTGAANGIGAATLELLAREGCRIGAVDLDGAALASVISRLPAAQILPLVGDAADRDFAGQMVTRTVERFGRLDIAIFNAGIVGRSLPVRDYPIEEFDRVMRVNVHGPWHGIRAAVPRMIEADGGSIVLTSSINGIRGFANFSAYAASKHAVMGLARTAAIDLARHRIRVNSVHPGLVDTRMMRDVETMVAPESPADAHASFAALVPLKRYAAPGEIASLMAWLASEEASYVTGAACVADGGFTTGIPG